MRLQRIFFLLFFLFASIGLFLRSDLGTRLLLSLTPKLPVTYSSLQGSVFTGVTLEDVRVEVPGGALTVKRLEVELSAFRLLRRQLYFNRCIGDGLAWIPGPDAVPLVNGGRPSPLTFSIAAPDFTFTNVEIHTLKGDAHGTFRLGRRFERAYTHVDATGNFGTGELDLLLRDHQVKLRVRHNDEFLTARGPLPAFIDLKTAHGPKAPGRLAATYRGPYGKATARRDLTRTWTIHADAQNIGPISHPKLYFVGTVEQNQLTGLARVNGTYQNEPWQGSTRVLWTYRSHLFQFSDLSLTSPMGSICGHLLLDFPRFIGHLEFDLNSVFPELHGTLTGSLDASLSDNIQLLSGSLVGRALYYANSKVAEVSATFDLQDLYGSPTGSVHANGARAQVGPYDFASVQLDANSSGTAWPFSLSATGPSLSFEAQGESDTLVYLSGTLHNRPLELLEPAPFTRNGIEHFRLQVGEGTLAGSLQRTSFDLTLDNVETLSGTARYNWQSQEGACDLTFPQGSLNALFNSHPTGALTFHGRVEELLDVLDIGPHRLEGQADIDIGWRGPLLTGTATLQQGRYENYRTGTELLSLDAALSARGHTLHLTHLNATDSSCQGTLSGTGSVAFSPLSFTLDTTFENFTLAQISWADARADGTLRLKGDRTETTIAGHVLIDDAHLTIPEKIAAPLPDLPVRYLHATRPAPVVLPPSSYPVHLDIHVQAPHNVTVSGRGLTSTWEGDLTLRGTLDALQATGASTLTQGELIFSGRVFKLTDGTLSFTGTSTPTLKLSGSVVEKGVTLTAHLEGPLNRPRLTFQSSPPLPQSTLFAYLLFGEDISELTAFQAIQLANTLAALASNGPDLLDTTRRSLGVDRLRVITAPSSRPGEETIALQVGKYIADGVIVTLTQSADNSSPSIAVEVDLHKGFYFEAENDNIQEQGRFSLKWNKNY